MKYNYDPDKAIVKIDLSNGTFYIYFVNVELNDDDQKVQVRV